MATKVVGELYESITGQLFEIGRQLRQPNGYPFDPTQLKVHLQAAVEGRFQSGVATLPVPAFSRDMTKEGWTLVEGFDEPDPAEFSATEFEFVPILHKDETFIPGAEMRKRALQENANFGQRFGEWLLAHPDRIPARPGGIFYIPLPRTVWRRRDGHLDVPYLHWDGERWVLRFRWLERGGTPVMGFCARASSA